MTVIGEAVVVLRLDTAGAATAARKGLDSQLASEDLFGGVGSSAGKARAKIEDDFSKAGQHAGDSIDHAKSRISTSFTDLGTAMGNWGIPFAGSVQRIGKNIEDTHTKGQKFWQSMSTVGGLALTTAAVGAGAIAAESIHLAMGLQEADAQIASHENISFKAATGIGKAFTDTAGTTIFSANEMASAFAPISGMLAQVSGHALTAKESVGFMTNATDLAEASGSDLSSTTRALAAVMQSFQVPVSGTTQLTNEMFNASRVTGVGLGTLASTIDRLKARLGIAAPTVSDLSSLLIDLNEHGITGSRGLMVVNSAVTSLLGVVPKVDAAQAKAANTLETKVTKATAAADKATSALSTTQEAAAAKVAKAQQNLVDVQDRIAASTTASAPTVSQQIELQKAQQAVTDAQTAAAQKVTAAQDKVSAANSKLTGVQGQAATSSNKQVQAMQALGLQIYDSSGRFVGMRSVIEQLSPRLHEMTQEQQLQTTSAIFGAGASKALLTTILAGPAAYDKAANAVNHSSTAHKGAVEQNQSLARQLDILKATLVDEGDKIGTALIPKVRDLAHWTAESIQWMQKHKGVAEALGGTIGIALTATIGAFVVNTGRKWIGSMTDAAKAIGNLSTTVLQKLGIMKAANDDQAAGAQTDADKMSTAAESMANSMSTAADQIISALDRISGQLQVLVADVGGNEDEIQASLANNAAQWQLWADKVMAAQDEVALGAQTTAEKVTLANEESSLTGGGIGGGGRGLGRLFGRGGGVAGEAGAVEGEAGGLLGGASVGGAAMGAAGVAGVGLIGVQLYNSLAEKKVGHLIGTNAASAIGDTATGAAIGAGIGSVVPGIGTALGAGIGAAGGLAFAERKPLERGAHEAVNIINSGLHKIPGASEVAHFLSFGIFGGSAPPPHPTQIQVNKQHTAHNEKQIDVLRQLQMIAHDTAVKTGLGSAQTKAALASVYATENKWLPHLGKDESLKKVDQSIFLSNVHLQELKGKQAHLASDATLSASHKKLDQLDATLKAQKQAGASNVTLEQTRAQIKTTQDHIDQLQNVSKQISKDQTTIRKADETKQTIMHVNESIQALKTQIATMPPPPQKATGTLKLVKGA